MLVEAPLDESYLVSFTVDVFECPEGHGLCWHFHFTDDQAVYCPECQEQTQYVDQFEYNPNLPMILEEQYTASERTAYEEAPTDVIGSGQLNLKDALQAPQ